MGRSVQTFTFPTMGTMASLALTPNVASVGSDGAAVPAAPSAERLAHIATVETVFSDYDERFSLYKPDSEISRIADGRLQLTAASAQLRDSYAQAIEWRSLTNGAFSPHRPDGVVDLSGIVKAQAIARGAAILRACGEANALLTVGGDALALGSLNNAPWVAGIVDPLDRHQLLCSVDLSASWRAIATAGTAERGEHVWRLAGSTYQQVSVLAADIIVADVLSTAILAGGQETLDDATDRWDIDVLTVDAQGRMSATPRLHNSIVRPGSHRDG